MIERATIEGVQCAIHNTSNQLLIIIMINNDGNDVGGLAIYSSAETTDEISDEFDKNFMEEGIMPMLSSFTYKGNIDEQFLNL